MAADVRLIITGDGSHSLKNEALNETYHSFHGAVQESTHVFIKKGLDYWCRYRTGTPSVLEIGFGTGLNALLTYAYAADHKVNVYYETLETYPLPAAVYKELNFPAVMQRPELTLQQLALHDASWEKEEAIGPWFRLLKRQLSVDLYDPGQPFDIIYFDAFAPAKQPEMWTIEIIKKMFNSLQSGGILVTYCAQGQFKRNLKEAGFEVETLPGPPGKKEMVRATRPNAR